MIQVSNVKLSGVSISCELREMVFPAWMDQLNSHVFEAGKVYAIVSEKGYGGWALSYLLSGKTKGYTGNIFINDVRVTEESLSTYGWYVGEGVARKKNIFGINRELTVREQIEMAPSKRYSLEALIKQFDLALTRIERKFEQVGNERFNASTAIGLLHGRQIFGFPWIEDEVKNILSYRLGFCSAIIKQHKGISIIPVQSVSVIEEFADKIIYLN